jgi:anti-sigma regulatory factor (Ser/Thr protein kinase)
MRHQQLALPEEFLVRVGVDAVGRARRRISATVRAWNVPMSDSALADVELCATEVVTNALTHAGDECWVRVQWTGQFLQVEVSDQSLQLPVAADPSLSAECGRGLALVESFSQGWGWSPRELGKTVFFVVSDEAALTGTGRLTALVRTAQYRIGNQPECRSDELHRVPA